MVTVFWNFLHTLIPLDAELYAGTNFGTVTNLGEIKLPGLDCRACTRSYDGIAPPLSNLCAV